LRHQWIDIINWWVQHNQPHAFYAFGENGQIFPFIRNILDLFRTVTITTASVSAVLDTAYAHVHLLLRQNISLFSRPVAGDPFPPATIEYLQPVIGLKTSKYADISTFLNLITQNFFGNVLTLLLTIY